MWVGCTCNHIFVFWWPRIWSRICTIIEWKWKIITPFFKKIGFDSGTFFPRHSFLSLVIEVTPQFTLFTRVTSVPKGQLRVYLFHWSILSGSKNIESNPAKPVTIHVFTAVPLQSITMQRERVMLPDNLWNTKLENSCVIYLFIIICVKNTLLY